MRLGVVTVALAVAGQHYRVAGAAGVALVAAGVAHRAIGAHTRVRLSGDAYRRVARALMSTDVFDVSPFAVRQALDGGVWELQEAIISSSQIGADVIVSTMLVPLIVSTVPHRPVLILGIVLAMTVVLGLPLRRMAHRRQAETLAASMKLADTLTLVVEGRLELIAMAAEERFRARLDRDLVDHARSTRRAAVRSILVGRGPLALSLVVVAALVSLDAQSRDALIAALEEWALLLGASLPPFLGVLTGMQSVVRSSARLRPLADIVLSTPRPELERAEARRLPVPREVTADRVSFAHGGGEELRVFSDVSFCWRAGEVLVLQGANGSGKTTLLRVLLGLRPPTSGVVRVDGIDLAAADLRSLRAATAYLPQRPYLGEPHVRIREALGFSRSEPADEAAHRALGRVGIDLGPNPLDRQVGELSGGQRQRVALARLLLQDAQLFLLDEPDANLDRLGVEMVIGLVRELATNGKLVAVAAHTPDLIEVGDTIVDFGSRAALADVVVDLGAKASPPSGTPGRSGRG